MSHKTPITQEVLDKQQTSVDLLLSLRLDASSVTLPNDAALEALAKSVCNFATFLNSSLKNPPSADTTFKLTSCAQSCQSAQVKWPNHSRGMTPFYRPSHKVCHVLRHARIRAPAASCAGQGSWDFEKANVVFNIGAWYSQAAAAVDRSTPDGVKLAARQFINAAHVFAHIRDHLVPRLLGVLPHDLRTQGLTMLSNLMLAQAQACFYERASAMQSSPAVKARLAAHAAHLYRSASEALPSAYPDLKNIRKAFNWHVHLDFQCASFDGAAFFQQSKASYATAEKEATGYGNEIAYLDLAERAVRSALNTGDKHGVSTTSARSLLDAIVQRKAAAIDDNNRIYMNAVPEQDELTAIQPAAMAKLPDTSVLPDLSAVLQDVPRLFSTLVSPAVASALNHLMTWHAEELAAARHAASEAADIAKTQVASLGLPGSLDALSGSQQTGVPDDLWNKIEAVQIQGAWQELQRLYAANRSTAARANSALDMAAAAMQHEEQADAAARTANPALPSRTAGQALADGRSQLDRMRRALAQAGQADSVVEDKLAKHEQDMKMLQRSRESVAASLPAVGGSTAAAASASDSAAAGAGGAPQDSASVAAQLRQALRDLDALLDSREQVLNSTLTSVWGEAEAAAALTSVPMSAGPEALDAAVTRLKHSFEEGKAAFSKAMDEPREALLGKIVALNERLGQVRQLGAQETARRDALQRLAAAVDKFEDIKSNLKEGEMFYSGLRTNAENALRSVQDLVHAREEERKELTVAATSAAAAAMRTSTDAQLAQRMGGMHISQPAAASSSAASYAMGGGHLLACAGGATGAAAGGLRVRQWYCTTPSAHAHRSAGAVPFPRACCTAAAPWRV